MKCLRRIQSCFAHARPRAALMPYFTLGYPDAAQSLDIVEAIANAGADLIELGIPFSDPLADGPTIQHSTQVALQAGATVEGCLELTAGLRSRGVQQPLLLMGYINPILSFGMERFVAQACAAGADGFILPDLPLEETDTFEALCGERACALVHMLAPTSTPNRVAQAADRSKAFIYLVSLAGTTGARHELPKHLERFVSRVREHTDLPLAVGFGISTPRQASAVARLADGVIVGSALIDAVRQADDDKRPQAAADFVEALRQSLARVQGK
jgi:tryptophan synthase alpha chain